MGSWPGRCRGLGQADQLGRGEAVVLVHAGRIERGGGGGGGGMVGACSLGIVCERLGLKGDGTAYFDAELTFLSANCR